MDEIDSGPRADQENSDSEPDKPLSYNDFNQRALKTRNSLYFTLVVLLKNDFEKITKNYSKIYHFFSKFLFLAIIRIVSNSLSPYYAALFFDAVQIFSLLIFGLVGTLRKSAGLLITYLLTQLVWAIVMTISVFAWITQIRNSDKKGKKAGFSAFLIFNHKISKMNIVTGCEWMEVIVLTLNLLFCVVSFIFAGLYLRIAYYYQILKTKSKISEPLLKEQA